jgi:hypothetical protein
MSNKSETNSADYIRVGDDYYKITFKPDRKGNLHRVLAKRSKTTITDDYGRRILSKIDSYEDFVIVPSHTNYQQEIHQHYNQYFQISHVPKKGSVDTIINFLSHIFGEQYLDFILDYFQILYLNPNQNLPCILLESKERNTGKSTFGYFIEKIFQFNAVALGSDDLTSSFNSVWIGKLAIVVDETSLEEKTVMETIKRLSTEKGRVLSNAKGKDKTDVEFFGKFIFASNDEGKALPIQRGEQRFAVFKVPTFASTGKIDNPDILDDLVAEIPAFLYSLQNRELVHLYKGRMHFAPEVYHTPQLELYFEGSLGYFAKSILSFLEDAFAMFPEEETLSYSLSNLILELVSGSYIKFADKPKLKKAIEDELEILPERKGRYVFYSYKSAENNEDLGLHMVHQNNVYYKFSKSIVDTQSLNSTNVFTEKVEQMAF